MLAHETIADIRSRGKLPILVGGTGLYVDSVVNDIVFTEIRTDPDLRKSLYRFAEEKGNAALLKRLRDVDPDAASRIHENNVGRIVRALEVYELTGITMTEQQRRSRNGPSRYRALKVGLNYKSRPLLYSRIDRRVDLMMERGLLEEAKSVLSCSMQTAVQAIGYKELRPYLDGEAQLEECIAKLKQSTRHYAKRQLTWFLRDPDIQWFYPDEEEMTELIKKVFVLVEMFLEV